MSGKNRRDHAHRVQRRSRTVDPRGREEMAYPNFFQNVTKQNRLTRRFITTEKKVMNSNEQKEVAKLEMSPEENKKKFCSLREARWEPLSAPKNTSDHQKKGHFKADATVSDRDGVEGDDDIFKDTEKQKTTNGQGTREPSHEGNEAHTTRLNAKNKLLITKSKDEQRSGRVKRESENAAKKIKYDENEISGAQAEQSCEDSKHDVFQKGESITVNQTMFRLLAPVTGDYGIIGVIEENSKESLLLHYETINCKCKRIQVESKILVLGAATAKKHIYRLLYYGEDSKSLLRCLVTEPYGPTISELRAKIVNEKFSPLTCLKLAYLTAECIEELHKIGFIHRDIKPGAFVIGNGDAFRKLFIVHFGLARRYRDINKALIPRRPSAPLLGTVKYISRNCHYRHDRSLRDDIESWLYMVAEIFEKENLTWRRKTNTEEIRKDKEDFMTQSGFQKSSEGLPHSAVLLVRHINSLEFESTPDYYLLKKVFREAIRNGKFKQKQFDWVEHPKAFGLKTDHSEEKQTESCGRCGKFSTSSSNEEMPKKATLTDQQ